MINKQEQKLMKKTEQCYTNRELSWFYQDAYDRCVKEV